MKGLTAIVGLLAVLLLGMRAGAAIQATIP